MLTGLSFRVPRGFILHAFADRTAKHGFSLSLFQCGPGGYMEERLHCYSYTEIRDYFNRVDLPAL